MQILRPKELYEVPTNDPFRPLFFLVGPVRGAGDWQSKMCRALGKLSPDCVIICPCRWDDAHPMAEYFPEKTGSSIIRQLAWEQYYLYIAGISSQYGCIVSWLGPESKTHPHPGPEPYAMDTRGELGEWRMRMAFEKARMVVGGKKSFPGYSQIERNFKAVLNYRFEIFPTISETAKVAVEAAANKPMLWH